MRLDNISDRRVFVAPSGGVSASELYLIGAVLVFAAEDADAGDSFVGVHRDHVIRDAPKATGEAWAPGDQLYWDESEGELTTTASGNTAVAIAASTAASGDDSGDIELQA